jgi:hypothetical protein
MRWGALLLLGLMPARAEAPSAPPSTGAFSSEEALQSWLLRTSRMEGASADVQEASRALKESAASVHSAGRMHSVGALLSHGRELRRKVASASLAAQNLSPPVP